MNKYIGYSSLIQENAVHLSGVFTYADLAVIVGTSEKTLLPRRIRELESAGVLSKFVRGFYLYKKKYDPRAVSQRLCAASYISLESVLAKHLVIGPIPRFRTIAVKRGRSRTYKSKEMSVEHLGIAKHLFFGFRREGGINEADAEKAYLDCLYFYQKGRHPTFNIFEDVNLSRLDLKKIKTYLKAYKNPKFVKFVENLIKENL